MPTYRYIECYYTELEDIIQLGVSDNESSIRAAFRNCISQYCSDHLENLKLISDDAVKSSLSMVRGYWEAKNTPAHSHLNEKYPDVRRHKSRFLLKLRFRHGRESRDAELLKYVVTTSKLLATFHFDEGKETRCSVTNGG